MTRKADHPCAGGCGKMLYVGRGSLPEPRCRECWKRETLLKRRHNCPQCGKEHELKNLYCCRACFVASAHNPPKQCENCGKMFFPKKGGAVFCDMKCRNEGYAKRGARGEMPHQHRGPRGGLPQHVVTIEVSGRCEWCQREFILRRGRGPKRKTCSEDCQRYRNSQLVAEGIMRRYYSDPVFRREQISKGQNRRVKSLGLEGITQPTDLVAFLLERDGVCGICLQPVTKDMGPMGPSIGHIVPLSRGGLHVIENVRLEHLTCNLRKHNKLDEELTTSGFF